MAVVSSSLLYIALLDVVMLAFVCLHTVWRQRVVQLVIVGVCAACFAILFTASAVSIAGSDYPRDTLVLLAISLYLTTVGSAVALVYLILAVTRSGKPAVVPHVVAGRVGAPSPLPPPPVPGPSVAARSEPSATAYFAPPPLIPAGAARTMPVGVGIAIASIFGISILLKLSGLARPNFHASMPFLFGLVVDVVMVLFGIWQSKWLHPKLEFAVVLVATSIAAFFFLNTAYILAMKFSYMARYWPADFYMFQVFSLVRLGAAVTALVFCIRSAFGTGRTAPIHPRPSVPSA